MGNSFRNTYNSLGFSYKRDLSHKENEENYFKMKSNKSSLNFDINSNYIKKIYEKNNTKNKKKRNRNRNRYNMFYEKMNYDIINDDRLKYNYSNSNKAGNNKEQTTKNINLFNYITSSQIDKDNNISSNSSFHNYFIIK